MFFLTFIFYHMARIYKQVLGKLKKSVGDVTFSKWKDVDTVRAKASEVSNPRTPAQVAVREKFTSMSKSAQSFGDIIRIGMKPLATSMTEYNAWQKQNYAGYAFDGENITIEVKLINKVAMEKGMALPAPVVTSPAANTINVAADAIPAGTYTFDGKAAIAIASPETGFIQIVGKKTGVNADAAIDEDFEDLPAGTYVVYFFTYGNNGAVTSASVATQVVVAN